MDDDEDKDKFEELRPEARAVSHAWRLAWQPSARADPDFQVEGDEPEWDADLFAEALHYALDEVDRLRRIICERAAHGRPGHESDGDYDRPTNAADDFGWEYLYPRAEVAES